MEPFECWNHCSFVLFYSIVNLFCGMARLSLCICIHSILRLPPPRLWERWEIVVHGLTDMKNFRVSKTTYLFIRFHRTGIPLSFIGSHDRWTYVTCCKTTPNNYCFHGRTRKSGAKSILFVRDLFCMRKLLLEHNDDIRIIESKVQNIWIYNKP